MGNEQAGVDDLRLFCVQKKNNAVFKRHYSELC